MQKLDAKFYGLLRKVKNDEVVMDGEWMVFLAKDNAFPATLDFYRKECVRLGADADQIAAIDRVVQRVREWRRDNPHRLKVPDARGEKMSDI